MTAKETLLTDHIQYCFQLDDMLNMTSPQNIKDKTAEELKE